MPKKKVAIGIDLGTTKCCVGIVRDGKVEIIENERSNKTTPSYVAFTDTERLVGEDAKDQTALNPTNTVLGVKKLLGQCFESPEVQRYVPDTLPFRVSGDATGNPEIHVTYKKEGIRLIPEQVTAMLLGKMKELVETRLDCVVDEAVISVPASFTNAQRQATKDAATIAGLKVLALVNETTAAAIAYQANRKRDDKETIAIVDFGGGKLDVSIVSVKKDSVEVEATFGSSLVGGTDIDDHLVRILMDKFKLIHNIDISSNSKAKERLRCSCVRLKHTLALLPESRVQLDSLDADKDLDVIITRKEFENYVGGRIRKVFTKVVQRVLSEILVQGLSVNKVLLVGGTTRIPMVQKLLLESFSRLDRSVNPDEAVAQGAALMTTFSKFRVHDVNLHALYLDTGSERQPLFEKFTSVPASRTVVLPVKRGCGISLVEWQYKLGGSCGNYLARNLSGFLSQKIVKFNFTIDQCGIFQATARSGIDSVKNCMRFVPKQSMKEMINVEMSFKIDSDNERNRISALSELESCYFSHKSHLEAQHRQRKLSTSTFENLSQKFNDIITWIDSSPNATKHDYDDKKLYLEKLSNTHSSHRISLPDGENTKSLGSRALRSQSVKEKNMKGERVFGQDISSTHSDRKMVEEMETESMRENEVKFEISQVQLLKNHPNGLGTPHVGCRVKRARTEPEGQEALQRKESGRNQLSSTDWKLPKLSDHDKPCLGSFARSSFRDYPTDKSECQARMDNPTTSSEKLRIFKQVLDSALLGVQQDLEQQGYTPNGVQHEVLGKENRTRSRKSSVESKLETDVDDLVDEFADGIRNRLKNVMLTTKDRRTNSQDGNKRNACPTTVVETATRPYDGSRDCDKALRR